MVHPTLIETPRLHLRPFVESDAPSAFGWFGDGIVMRYTPSGPDSSLQQVLDRIAIYQQHQVRHGFSRWIIVTQEMRCPIGDSGLLVMPESGNVKLGFRLARPWWGKGLATEAARAWVRTAFDTFSLPRLTAFTHPDNKASLHVLVKLGFRLKRECILRKMQALEYSLGAPDVEDVA